MRKIFVLAMIMAVLVAGTAMADRLMPRANATFSPGAPVSTTGAINTTNPGIAAFGPTTTNNDDSCDIGVAPAATLLLPYFEVDVTSTAGTGRTTIFSVTNVTALPQIAHVTVWTDWSFPVLDFNLFLTGYDVQPINLYDVIARGLIGGTTGTSTSSPNARTSSGTTTNPNLGTQPFLNTANPYHVNLGNCAPGRLPGQLPAPLAADVRAALTVGRSTGAAVTCAIGGVEQQIGGNHGANTAIGYVTIDVSNTCSTTLPISTSYYTGEILYDNVFIGDYADVQQSTTTGNYAGGNPLVHIRAIPEGGPAGSIPPGVTNLPFTFYDRYTGNFAVNVSGFRNIDRRQPLPSAFAARWISGSTAAFDTQYKIWREGVTTDDASTACNEYVLNSNLAVSEMVRFDERENATTVAGGLIVSPLPPGVAGLPEAARVPVTSSSFPANTSTDVGGWMFMNLNNNDTSGAYSVSRGAGTWGVAAGAVRPSQNWVIVSMFANGLFGVDYDAAWLGNGCSPASPLSSSAVAAATAFNRIGPTGGVNVCPTGPVYTAAQTTLCTGTNATP
jgi:hypothetical protein